MSEKRDQQPSEVYIAKMEALTIDEREVVISAIRASEAAYGYRIEQHFCFRNSQILTLADHDLQDGSRSVRYFEGHIASDQGAVPHAWIEINGKIVDTTLMCSPEGLRALAKTKYYFKQEVPLEDVRDYFGVARGYGEYGTIRRLILVPRDEISDEALQVQQRGISRWWRTGYRSS